MLVKPETPVYLEVEVAEVSTASSKTTFIWVDEATYELIIVGGVISEPETPIRTSSMFQNSLVELLDASILNFTLVCQSGTFTLIFE